MRIKDFKVGQTVFVELIENAKRRKGGKEIIEEWEITKVGKKYIYAMGTEGGFPIQFEKRDYGTYKGQFVEKTDFSPEHILYASKNEYEKRIEYEKLSKYLFNLFRYEGSKKLSLKQLRKIKAIIEESEE